MHTIHRLAAAGLLALAGSAHAAYGIGHDGAFTWEQVRFYGPAGGANATYTHGQPMYLGQTAQDLCTGADRCGAQLSFDTLVGGTLKVTGSDADASTANLAIQDRSPSYGGLGVIGRKNGHLVGGDEINRGDTLTLSFDHAVKVVGFHFFDKDHGGWDLNRGDQFGLSVDNGPVKFFDLQNFPWYGANSTLVGTSFTFSYKNEDYYLGAIKVAAVPEPQTYAMLLVGLLAGGFMLRRRVD